MTVNNAYQFIKDRLNRNNSGQGQGISQRQFVWAFNMAQYFWFDQRVKFDNIDKVRQEELQMYLQDVELSSSNEEVFNTAILPNDYYYYQRAYAICSSIDEKCREVQVYARPVEEGNVNSLLLDSFQKPSLLWQDSFFTVGNGRIRFYHNNDFAVQNIHLTYYRTPTEIDMKEIIDEVGFTHDDVDPELSNSSLYEVLNITALILSGDTGNIGSFQALSTYLQQFN